MVDIAELQRETTKVPHVNVVIVRAGTAGEFRTFDQDLRIRYPTQNAHFIIVNVTIPHGERSPLVPYCCTIPIRNFGTREFDVLDHGVTLDDPDGFSL